MANRIETKWYHGFCLHKCWCGHPEMRWLVYYGMKCYGSAKNLFLAERKCDYIMANNAY